MDRISLINNFFYSFNRDPYQNKNLVSFFISETNQFPDHVLAAAIKDLRAEDGPMPKIGKLVSHCKKIKPIREHAAVACFKCGSLGMIYKVICRRPDGTKFELNSLNHSLVKESQFYPIVMGHCGCSNGEQYDMSSNNSLLKTVEPPGFLQILAKERGIDCALAANVCASEMRAKVIDRKKSSEPSDFSKAIYGTIKVAMKRLYGMSEPEVEEWFKNNTQADPKECEKPAELEFFTPWTKEDDIEKERFK